MDEKLRDRLARGDRRVTGAAAAVTDDVFQNTDVLEPLIGLLDDGDEALIAHCAHALMQVSVRQPQLFDPYIDRLLDHLRALKQWEIGEQLPKILVRTTLSPLQAQCLYEILAKNMQDRSNIVAACSLQAILDLAQDGRIEASLARNAHAVALNSERKALAARARRVQKMVATL